MSGSGCGDVLGLLEGSLSEKPWILERQQSTSLPPALLLHPTPVWPWQKLFPKKPIRVQPSYGEQPLGRCAEAFQDRYPSSNEVFNLPENKGSRLRWLLKAFPRIWLLNFHSNELSLFPCCSFPMPRFTASAFQS